MFEICQGRHVGPEGLIYNNAHFKSHLPLLSFISQVTRKENPMPVQRFGIMIVFLLVLSLVFLSGCAKVRFTPTGDSYPPYSGTVKILKTYPSESKYSEIGWVSADGDFNTPWSELLALMQQEAANRGANAIVLEDKFTTKLDTPQYSVGVNQRNDIRSVTAIAIRVD